MNRRNTIIIFACFVAIFMILVSPLSSVATIQAQAQEKEKFFMSLKLVNSQPNSILSNNGAAYNIPAIISDNLNKSGHGTYANKTIEYNLKEADAQISDSDLHLTIPITVIDSTSKPNIITSYKSKLGVDILSDLIKERNTLTNTTTYSGDGDLTANYANIGHLDVNATIYPNATGIMELREK
jgi:hypothetical protein